jgi:O-antigen/teichoic acid export membrane protein
MQQRIKSLIYGPIFKGSLTVSLLIFAGSFFNYLFNMIMGRMLGPADYGILAALLSIVYVLSVFSSSVQVVSSKYTSIYKAEGNTDKINALFWGMNRKMFWLSIGSFLLIFALSPLIARFLNIPSTLTVMIFSTLFLVTFLAPVNRGILQGLQRFFYFAISFPFESGIKLLTGVLLVVLGFGVNGAAFAPFFGVLLAYFIIAVPLLKLFKKRKKSIRLPWREMLVYAKPVFLTTLGLSGFLIFDVFLVKHYFPPYEAGLYAALSLMGRIIFFITGPVNQIMFPLVSESYQKKKNYKQLMLDAFLLVTFLSAAVLLFYYFFPTFSVKLIFGSAYLGIQPYLIFFGFTMFMYSVANVLVYYFLATQRTMIYILPLIFSTLLIILLIIFHQTLWQVVWVQVLTNTLFFISTLVFYFVKRCSKIVISSQ